MSTFRRHVLRVYVANGINGVLGIIVVPVAVTVLGRDGYALFSIYALVYAYVVLLESGITKNLVRLLSLDTAPDAQARQLHRVFGCYLLVSIMLLVALPIAVVVVPRDVFQIPAPLLRSAGWIVAIAVVEYLVALPSATVTWYGIAMQRFDRSTRFTVVSGLYRYAFLFFGLLWFRTPEAAVACAAGRRLLDLWVAPMIIGRLPPGSWRIRLNRAGLHDMLRDAVPMTLAQFGVTSLTALPSVFSSRWFGVESLGVFRAVFDLCSRVWFFSVGFGQVLFPKLVRSLSGEEDRAQSVRIREGMTWSWMVYTALAFGGALVMPWVLALLHLEGPDLGWLFITTLLGTCISAHTQFAFELLQAGRRYGSLLVAVAATLVLLPVVATLLRPWGLLSVAVSWLVGQFFYASSLDAAALARLRTPWRSQGNLLLVKTTSVVGVLGLGQALATASYLWGGVALAVLLFAGLHARRAHAA